MITKNLFKEIIEVIQKQSEKEHRFCDAIEEMVDSRIIHEFSINILRILLKLLQEIFNDKDDWIGYWLYELNSGKDYRNGCATQYNKNVKLKTIDDLYKFLKQNYDSN